MEVIGELGAARDVNGEAGVTHGPSPADVIEPIGAPVVPHPGNLASQAALGVQLEGGASAAGGDRRPAAAGGAPDLGERVGAGGAGQHGVELHVAEVHDAAGASCQVAA